MERDVGESKPIDLRWVAAPILCSYLRRRHWDRRRRCSRWLKINKEQIKELCVNSKSNVEIKL